MAQRAAGTTAVGQPPVGEIAVGKPPRDDPWNACCRGHDLYSTARVKFYNRRGKREGAVGKRRGKGQEDGVDLRADDYVLGRLFELSENPFPVSFPAQVPDLAGQHLLALRLS